MVRDFLAIGTASGAVLMLRVDIGSAGMGISRAGATGNPVDGDGGDRIGPGGAGSISVVAVKAVPFRRICLPDGCPVTFLTFVVPGGGGEAAGKEDAGGRGGGGGAPRWLLVSLVVVLL